MYNTQAKSTSKIKNAPKTVPITIPATSLSDKPPVVVVVDPDVVVGVGG